MGLSSTNKFTVLSFSKHCFASLIIKMFSFSVLLFCDFVDYYKIILPMRQLKGSRRYTCVCDYIIMLFEYVCTYKCMYVYKCTYV